MAAPARYDFQIWSGATFRQTITLYEASVGSDPKDLTGYSALCTIKDGVGDEATTLLTLSTANSRIILGDEEGTIELVISATDTEDLDWTRGFYQLTITGTDTDPLLHGSFTVKGA